MKGPLIENFYRLFDVIKPQRICEIGTHDGKSAGQMCEYLLQMGLTVDYTGYDLFEEANDETHKIGHKWHKDTGTDNHMSWCQVGLSVLLTNSFTGGLMYYADDDSGKNKTLVKRKVGDLCVHDSSEWHMVEPHEGKRTVLLIFI